jgi:hypothetical protein
MLVIQVTRESSASSGQPKRTACEILEVLFSADPDVDLPWVMRSGAEITRFGAALGRGSGGLVTVHRVEQRVNYVEIQ